MIFIRRFIAASMLAFLTLPLFAAENECERRLISSEEERRAFVSETAGSSVGAVATGLFGRLLRVGPPSLMLGIAPGTQVWWAKNSLFSKVVYGTSSSPWGALEFITQTGRAHYLIVNIHPMAGDHTMTADIREKLRKLYPTLRVTLQGEQAGIRSAEGTVPETIVLELDKDDFADPNEFPYQARSLARILLEPARKLIDLQVNL